jgi:hypothetical protein
MKKLPDKILALHNISVIRSTQKNNKTNKQTTMNQTLKQLIQAIRRPAYFLAAFTMLTASVPAVVEAAATGGQLQFRSIKMSDNGVSGGPITTGYGSGTGVTYRVTFRAATSYTIKGLALDFCSGTGGTPFIGDSTCAAPAGFTVGGSPTVDTTSFVDSSGTTASIGSGWTTASSNSGQTLTMTNSTGTALTTGTDYTFAVTGVTNTSELGTFYARFLTYTSDTGDVAAYDHATVGTYQDFGGFALSTAAIVQVTAKVQETLTFCVLGSSTQPPSAPTAPTSCASPVSPAITLGHGTNNTLDTSAIDTNTVYTYASTNALHGVTIRMKNGNSCGGLSTDNGTTCAIPAIGAGSATPSLMTAGTAAFGMFCNDSTTGTGTVTCDAGYRDVAHVTTPIWYGMDSATAAENVTTTFGDVIAAATAPVNGVINEYQFAATASNTTPAGIYTSNMAMIATGTF